MIYTNHEYQIASGKRPFSLDFSQICPGCGASSWGPTTVNKSYPFECTYCKRAMPPHDQIKAK